MKKYIYTFLSLILLSITTLMAQTAKVTTTPAFCEGDGQATFTVNNAKVGGTLDITIYKLPNTTTPFRSPTSLEIEETTVEHTEYFLQAGSYMSKVVHSFEGDEDSVWNLNFTIAQQFTPITASNITFSSQAVCDNQSKTTVNVSGSGRPRLYELRNLSGQAILPFQESNVFPPIDNGNYRIAIEDECGNITVKDFTVNLQFAHVEGSFKDHSKFTACNMREDFKVTLTGKRGSASTPTYIQPYHYPIQVAVEVTDATNNVIYQGTHTINNQEEVGAGVSLPPELNPGDKLTTKVTITDNCGVVFDLSRTDTYNPSFSFTQLSNGCNQKYFRLSGFSQFYPDSETTITFTKYPDEFEPWKYNDDFNEGEYSNTYPSLTDAYTDGAYITFGNESNIVPTGQYEVKVTNACGAEVTRNATVSYNQPILSTEVSLSCQEEYYIIRHYFHSSNTNVAEVVVLEAPQAFIDEHGPLPFNANEYIVKIGNKDEFRMEVPAGSYQLKITNDCGDEYIADRSFSYTQELRSSEVNFQKKCGGIFSVSATADISGLYTGQNGGVSYFLQKWYPNVQEWGNPATGVTGSEPNISNAISFSSNIDYDYSGNFRVIAVPRLLSPTDTGIGICFNRYFELDQFTIPDGTIVINDYYTIGSCVNGKFNLMIDAVGIGELTYEITHKNGLQLDNPISNGNDPVFVKLEQGEYTVKVTDDECGDALTARFKVNATKLPIIKAQELCEGENGRLYVNGASFLTVKWYRNNDFTGVTGHSYNFTPYDPEAHKDVYYAHISYPENEDFCFDGDQILSFNLTPQIMNDVYAGEGQTVTIERVSITGGFVNLFDNEYLKNRESDGREPDTHGEWTDMDNSGALYNHRWDVSQVPGGTYRFKYRVEGTCEDSDETIVTIKLIGANYWHGAIDNDWAKEGNWTGDFVPAHGEDVEFATEENNGPLGAGNGKGEAVKDLHLDKDRVIGDLINQSDMNLVITAGNQLIINGEVVDDNNEKGTIVVKADANQASGTLLFTDPTKNDDVEATVEFINKAYECDDCGFYRKQWQYFGIPVEEAGFPYLTPKVELINQWVEPYSELNKWRPAPYAPDTKLKAFKGYEITNTLNTKSTNVYRFDGKLNVGNAMVPLTKTSNVTYSGINLIGNSFTAAIPITDTAIELGVVELEENTVYLFNMGTRDQWRKLSGGLLTGVAAGQYQAVPFNLAGQIGIPDRVLSMHTFMVNTKISGHIELKYDNLVKNELNEYTDKAWRTAAKSDESQTIPYIVMDIVGNGSADRVWIFEHTDATTEFDNGWDGYKMKEGDLIQVYVSGSDQSDYQIATVPNMIETTIGISAEKNENFTIYLSVSPEVEARNMLIRDLFTGRNYPIINGTEYLIAGIDKSIGNRFKIIASSESLNTDHTYSQLNIFVRDNIIYIDNQSEELCSAFVYDQSGKLVTTKQIQGNTITGISKSSQLTTGIYIIKVASKTKAINKTDRVLIK